ncbi:hypothetical protein D3C83_328000 [compost metagenome]
MAPACRDVTAGSLVIQPEERVVVAAFRPDTAKTMLAILLLVLAGTLVLGYIAFTNGPITFAPTSAAP